MGSINQIALLHNISSNFPLYKRGIEGVLPIVQNPPYPPLLKGEASYFMLE